jgi:hypothetical protein
MDNRLKLDQKAPFLDKKKKQEEQKSALLYDLACLSWPLTYIILSCKLVERPLIIKSIIIPLVFKHDIQSG